jgi:NADPH:quinone reductase-like Zn-dependent oxidoreductase
MRTVLLNGFGGTDVLTMGEVETPELGEGGVLTRVAAAVVNRADLLRRRGALPSAGKRFRDSWNS